MRWFLRVRWSKLVVACVVFNCLILVAMNFYNLKWMEALGFYHEVEPRTNPKSDTHSKPVYLVFGINPDSGYLKHVFDTFHHFGYERGSLSGSKHWDVLWSHDYPFKILVSKLRYLKPYQMINHFPGSSYITYLRHLAVSRRPHFPRAFKIPQHKQQLLEYVKINPHKIFVKKIIGQKGIKIETIESLDLKSNDSFVQEYIDKPFLVDGYKFDIGIYTTITSVDPLRVYIYTGEAMFRYCLEKYHPFDPKKLNKYVIGDDYRPTWEVPSLKKLYQDLEYSMKDSFNAYVRKLGKDPSKIYQQIEEAIRTVCLAKEPHIVKLISAYPSTVRHNFFEMVRFDFVVDEDLNVYIMEANMSPNMSSADFPQNRLLYEQVLFHLFNLVGLANKINMTDNSVATKNVMVSANECSSATCVSCMAPQCHLCLPCLTADTLDSLKQAYREHTHRQENKRVFPPTMTQESARTGNVSDLLSPENQLMLRWFQAKCVQDISWC